MRSDSLDKLYSLLNRAFFANLKVIDATSPDLAECKKLCDIFILCDNKFLIKKS